MRKKRTDMLQGMLDLLILRTLKNRDRRFTYRSRNILWRL